MKKLIACLTLLALLITAVPAFADEIKTERLQWNSVSYVYFEEDSRGNISLGQGASFGDGRKIVYYTIENNPKWENKKIKSIKNVTVEPVNNSSKVFDNWKPFYDRYRKVGGGLSNVNITKQEIRNDNSIYLKANLAVNPKLNQNKTDIDTTKLANITNINDFNTFKSLGATIPDTIGNLRAKLEAEGKGLYVMPMFLLFTAEVEVEGAMGVDLYVKDLTANTNQTEPIKKYNGTVTYGLKDDATSPVQARLILTHNNYPVMGVDGQVVTFNPGETKSFNFNFTGQNDDSYLYAEIVPIDVEDINPANNSKELVIPMKEQIVPPKKGNLTFQAYSQAGEDVFGEYLPSKPRTPNTAKWTDRVEATLKPSAPTPPRGNLDWWKIIEAEITYPKKNPEFIFGEPLPPVGTTTIPMQFSDHKATAEFRQDWGMDGAKIYSIVHKKLFAEHPKNYSIKANYTIEYQYSYWVGSGEGRHKVTKIATETSSATGNLLVNGTGVNSLAQ